MGIFSLVIGTVLVALFLIMQKKGKQYEEMLAGVDGDEFPLKELFGVGMAWEYTVKQLFYSGKLGERIRPGVTIFYGERYCEYYCRIILAQVYTYVHLCLCFFCLLAGFITDATSLLLVLLGAVMGIALGDKYLKQVTEKVEKRADECVEEFPNMVMKLALMINSGMILREAWFTVADSMEGQLQELMKKSCELMENGRSDIDAIYSFGVNSGSKEIKKFSASLIQGIEKGNAELAGVLVQQSSELWESKRQLLLQKGEAAATKLVIPTTMMFAGLILIVISSALTGLSL